MFRKSTVSLDLDEFVKSLYLLMKPRVMSLVIFTCAVGFLTSNSDKTILDSIISIALVAIGAGAAGSTNTGGGGGAGSGFPNRAGGNGGPGIVVIRYTT